MIRWSWRASHPESLEPTATESHQKVEKGESCNLFFIKSNSGCFVKNELEVGRSTRREIITIIQVREDGGLD